MEKPEQCPNCNLVHPEAVTVSLDQHDLNLLNDTLSAELIVAALSGDPERAQAVYVLVDKINAAVVEQVAAVQTVPDSPAGL